MPEKTLGKEKQHTTMNSTYKIDMTRRFVVAVFWSVVLLGVPLWWKTTEVYRANLPLNEIKAWQMQQTRKIVLPTSFTIYIPSNIQTKDFAPRLGLGLNDAFNQLSSCIESSVSVSVESWLVPENWNKDFGDTLKRSAETPVGQYFIYIGTYGTPDLIYNKNINVTIGSYRTTIVQMRHLDQDSIEQMLQTMIPLVYATDLDYLGRTYCLPDNSEKHDVNQMRTLKYASKYQITFSLMNNNPIAANVGWDIRDAVKAYLDPFLKELSTISNFTVDSQIQNYASLSLKPQFKDGEESSGYYYYDLQQLPHFINSAEWNLASTISSYPTVNFVLFVPSHNEWPLYIHDSQGFRLHSNAFLLPRWGGVAIKNTAKTPKAETPSRYTKTDIQPMMNIFVSQLRTLMGVQDLKTSTTRKFPRNYNVTFKPATRVGITTLEKDSLLRRRTIENVMNSISTLHSLSNLVIEIPNMVILDHISIQIDQSLDSLRKVCDALIAGDYPTALHHSIDASELAEKAFFDPTMVSMLYFPDEHKYAIYMPLFVPISVPLVMALLKEIKKLKTGGKKSKID